MLTFDCWCMRLRVMRHKGRGNILPTAGNTGRWACIAPSSTPSFTLKKNGENCSNTRNKSARLHYQLCVRGEDAPSALHHLMKGKNTRRGPSRWENYRGWGRGGAVWGAINAAETRKGRGAPVGWTAGTGNLQWLEKLDRNYVSFFFFCQ